MELRIPPGDLTTLDPTAGLVRIDQFHPRTGDHRPVTTCRVAHGPRCISLRFDVRDRYVRCMHKGFQSAVWMDSCVEFFVQPKPGMGYFNFECNCGSSLLLTYVTSPRRDANNRLMDAQHVTAEQAGGIRVRSSLPAPFESEGDEPLAWWLTLEIPIDFMQNFVGPLADLPGQTWRGNFYKCGDETPRPHWGMWSAVGEKLDFHQPAKFGTLIFE